MRHSQRKTRTHRSIIFSRIRLQILSHVETGVNSRAKRIQIPWILGIGDPHFSGPSETQCDSTKRGQQSIRRQEPKVVERPESYPVLARGGAGREQTRAHIVTGASATFVPSPTTH